jgi:HSP20 family protein
MNQNKEVSTMNSILRLMPTRERFLSLIPEIDLLGRFFHDRELPEIFGREGEVVPAFDIAETENEYTITGEIPGIEVKDLDVTLAHGTLTIRGEKQQEREEKNEHFHRVERAYGSFQRGFLLPEGVTAEELKANYKDGILKISIPKTAREQKKIEVTEEKAPEQSETPVEVQ